MTGVQTCALPICLPTREPVVAFYNCAAASEIYQAWLNRLRVPQRFSRPDWSIADKWIAKELLRQGTPAAVIQTLLRCGSPGFPRGHADPENYLRRTLARALSELLGRTFPAPTRGARCVPDRPISNS